MRLLLVGAFPYPHFQGSQVYFQEQAIALRRAGADVSLLTYGEAEADPAGQGNQAGRADAEHWRAIDGFDHRQAARRSASRSLRSGLNWAKPRSDLEMAMTLRDAVASSSQRNDAYDAILTHNAEAALISLLSLPRRRPPILYCLHTLLGRELSAYLKGPKNIRFLDSGVGSSALGRFGEPLDRAGDAVDRWLGRRVNGWLALTHSSARVMRATGNDLGSIVPPPLPDPERALDALTPEFTARRHGLRVGGFFVYSGNLDAYQELDILGEAARRLARRSRTPPLIVIATHRRRETGRRGRRAPVESARPAWLDSMPGVEFREVSSAQEMLSLLAAARGSLLMRRAEGGFPIKLVNSLALSSPPIAFHEAEWGLRHEVNALIADPDRPGESLADALVRLAEDDALARRLARGARTLYLDRHLPERAAEETLALLERMRDPAKPGGGGRSSRRGSRGDARGR